MTLVVVLSGCTINNAKIKNSEQPPVNKNNNTNTNSQIINNQNTNDALGSKKSIGEIIVNGKKFILSNQECSIQATDGGPLIYSLEIKLANKTKSNFEIVKFSVQDLQNSKNNLMTVGTHTATGQHWDRFSNYLEASSYSLIMQPEDMDIVLEKVKNLDKHFSAEGYVNIKKTIKKECPEQIWIGGHYAKIGDSDYICTHKDEYLPAQKIYFKCDNGIIL